MTTAEVAAMAKTYYPARWSLDRLKALVAAGRMTADDYKAITGEDYTATTSAS